MEPSDAVVKRLRPLVAAHGDCSQAPVRFRPDTWRPWLKPRGLTAVLECGSPGPSPRERLIGRQDLDVLRDAVRTQADGLCEFFTAVMIWGSGTTNGRGPRYTEMALCDARLRGTLARTCELVRAGDLVGAYRAFRVAGVGSPFFTKWFAAVDDGSGMERALILDSRVFNTLNGLGWVSWKAAGTRTRAVRYAAYVHQMHSWARALDVDPSRLEWVMFHLNGEVSPKSPAH
ncbi:hypothetical protein [Streptomyces abyssalis]